MIFNIQRWSLHDGSGIRSTVFFKGCPLRCRWCSNPESWAFERQILYWHERCAECGKCVESCGAGACRMEGGRLIYDRDCCTGCGTCVKVCPNSARELVGEELTVEKIVDVLIRDAIFYRSSGGGVTFSGGEPMAQPELLRKLVTTCFDAGISTAVETSGFFDYENVADIFEYIDEVYIDLKQTHESTHKDLTGVSNRIIIENILRIDKAGYSVCLRVPLVKLLNDTEENVVGIINLCQNMQNLKSVELLSYHDFGSSKYAALGQHYDFAMASPDQPKIERIANSLQAAGIVCTHS